MLGLYFFFKGYVRAEITGKLKEKIINSCIRNGVFMWSIRSCGNAVSFNIRSCDVAKLEEISKGAKLVISDKKGVPYILGRFKKRYALTAGIVFFAVVLVFLSSLVLKINITGCKITDYRDIEKILLDNGVKKWCFKKKINEDYLEMRIMNELDTLSWINLDIKGTNLNVRVKERRAKPEMSDNIPTDLVASRDGVISALRVKNGEKAVAVGDTVIKGQLLVSGLVERDGDYMLPEAYTVHSKGEVIARTWYTFDIQQPLSETVKEYTGNEYVRRRAGISGFDINLYVKDIPYRCYDIKRKIYGGFFRFESEKICEIETNEIVYTVEEALEKAVSLAEGQLPEGVVTTQCITREYAENDGFVNLHIVFECTENIAVEKRRETTDDSKDSEIQ